MKQELSEMRQSIHCQNVINVDVACKDDSLKISVYEQVAGEIGAIQNYEDIPVSLARIEQRCKEIVDMLNTTNHNGRVSTETLTKLREVGQVFYDELFTQTTKEKLKHTKSPFLRLNIDDQLVQIPWELLYDGKQFLCQHFCMGRSVRTKQNVPSVAVRALGKPLSMLLIADPQSNLAGAYNEGVQIRNFMDDHRKFVHVNSVFDNITPEIIKEKIRNYDIVHFAGHAEYQNDNPSESGWRLTERMFKADDIMKMAGASAMPALVFSNACQSARTEKWELKPGFQHNIFGMANAFLLSGVKHYIGTFCEILDDPGCHFALRFYQNLRNGEPIGESVRLARNSLINEFGEETIAWTSYILYGDPTASYNISSEPIEPPKETKPVHISSRLRTPEQKEEEEVIVFDPKEHDKKRWGIMGLLGLLIVVLFVFLSAVVWFGSSRTPLINQQIGMDEAARMSETREKLLLLRDENKRKLIDQYIQSLEEKIPAGDAVLNTKQSDSITLMLDFRSSGFSNGNEQLIASVIAEEIIKQGKIQIVERQALDSILEELDFGTSRLVDASHRLSLGKIMSAKLILYGWVEHSKTDCQVSLRLTEIQTGQTLLATNEILNNDLPISAQKEILTKNLLYQLTQVIK